MSRWEFRCELSREGGREGVEVREDIKCFALIGNFQSFSRTAAVCGLCRRPSPPRQAPLPGFVALG